VTKQDKPTLKSYFQTKSVPSQTNFVDLIDSLGTAYDVTDFGAVGNGAADDTAAIQAAITAAGNGQTVTVRGNKTYKVTAPLSITNSNVRVLLAEGAVINHTVSGEHMFNVTGNNVTIEGGSLNSPAAWNGAQDGTSWCVIKATGDNFTARSVTINNIYKFGIYLAGDWGMVEGCHIHGNFPSASFTGTQTAHFGVTYDPTDHGHIINSNFIDTCVQGIEGGQSGTGEGLTIVGNHFEDCWNHGAYVGYGTNGITVSGNNFIRCQGSIAIVGKNHGVTGNVIFTNTTGNSWDLTGISAREAFGCVIDGNTIYGDLGTGQTGIALINTSDAGATHDISANIVSNNSIAFIGGTSIGIRVGATTYTTTCNDNLIQGNKIRCNGYATVPGLIVIAPDSTATSVIGNKITGNDIIVTGVSHGINVLYGNHTTIQNNSIRFEYNGSTTLGAIALASCAYTKVSENDVMCLSGFGTSVTVRGIWESGTTNQTSIENNSWDFANGSATFVQLYLVASSYAKINERGTGVPAVYAQPGSIWRRTDGGAGTSLYVKETAYNSTVWTKSSFAPLTVTGTTTLGAGDAYLRCNGTFNVYPPVATGTGLPHFIKNVGSGTISVVRQGSDLIDGATSVTLTANQTLSIVDAAAGVWDVA
jgi:hypothetical protein